MLWEFPCSLRLQIGGNGSDVLKCWIRIAFQQYGGKNNTLSEKYIKKNIALFHQLLVFQYFKCVRKSLIIII